MPKLLLLGDSIRMGYEHHVRTLLAPQYTVCAPAENGETSTYLLARVSQWQAEHRPDVVHLNCGLHDLRINPGQSSNQTPLAQFKANLEQIFTTLRSATSDLRLIWATITPVMDERHQVARASCRYNAHVLEYNAAACSIARSYGAEVNDLYAYVVQKGLDSIQGDDGLHYTIEGYALLAAKVAQSVKRDPVSGSTQAGDDLLHSGSRGIQSISQPLGSV